MPYDVLAILDFKLFSWLTDIYIVDKLHSHDMCVRIE